MLLKLKMLPYLLALLLIVLNPSFAIGLSKYNVVSLGARPDGKTDTTKTFVKAWNKACGSVGTSIILVPKGRYLIQNAITFNGSKCKSQAIKFFIRGTIVGPTDFRALGSSDTWLSFEYVTGVTISGGNFDGRGRGLWRCKMSDKGGCASGATTLSFTNSKNIVISRLTSLNSQLYHIVINGCKNVKVKGVKMLAAGKSPNTDGLHVQFSTGVTIINSKISTGDDCVSVGAGTMGLWIQNVVCGPGHGVSIGSLGKELDEPGVQNVTVKDVTFVDTQNGVRIKSWGRPSNGFVHNVVFQHCTMVNVQNPIIIDQNYCPHNDDCPGKVSGVKINDVTYKDIHGTSATKIAMKFDCSSKYPCQDIKLDNIKLTYDKQPAGSTCVHAKGSTKGLVVPKSCL